MMPLLLWTIQMTHRFASLKMSPFLTLHEVALTLNTWMRLGRTPTTQFAKTYEQSPSLRIAFGKRCDDAYIVRFDDGNGGIAGAFWSRSSFYFGADL